MTIGIEALEKIGPGNEATRAIRSTLFGRWVAQSTAILILIIGYLVAASLLHYIITERLDFFSGDVPTWLVFLYATPLLLVAVFLILPAVLKARRESRLFRIRNAQNPPDPGYFRLHPYQRDDAARYTRPDSALMEAMNWIQYTGETVLYLSGSSGSGKSSLVSAGIIPLLENKGWAVLETRGMGAPLTNLVRELHAATYLFANPPPTTLDALTLLSIAGAKRNQDSSAPLLIVLDQFEEYLTLENDEEKVEYAKFLTKLAENPISKVRLLHIVREDYRAQIFKQNLPDYAPRNNGFELAAFNRREAQTFLEGGPRTLSLNAYNALFMGLETLEGTRGQYRPITLNMIGYVLDREGARLTQEPGKLIERYLHDCVFTGDKQDSAHQVLDAMITAQGTKAARSENYIAEVSNLELWQVRATLISLREDGLLRQVNESWEISHDFLAGVLSRLLGRKQKPWWQLINTKTAAIAGAGWLVALGLILHFLGVTQHEQLIREVRSLGFDDLPMYENKYAFEALRNDHTNEELSHFTELVSSLPLTLLNLSNADGITDLSPLQNLPLTWLSISGADRINDLSPLKEIPLTVLNVSGAHGITDLSPLKGMRLTSLNISRLSGVNDLSPLQGMPLTTLDLSGADNITDLSPLKNMLLTSLILRGADGVADLSPLKGMPLTSIDLSGVRGVTDLSPLERMPLTSIKLRGASGITDISPLKDMSLTSLNLTRLNGITDLSSLKGMSLTSLYLTSLNRITDLSPLQGMPLTSLNLELATGITDLSPLRGMPLTSLDLSGVTEITDLSPLEGMPLKSLDLSDASGVTDLSPLKGMQLTSLDLAFETGITDLAPLQGMPLSSLNLALSAGITDLTPLRGMPLTSLDLTAVRGVTDLSPLQGMPLNSLDLSNTTGITDLSPLKGIPLRSLDLREATGITDLSPLRGMNTRIIGVSGNLASTLNN